MADRMMFLLRSIPASAGEPHGRQQTYIHTGVYPRECGEPPTAKARAYVLRVYPRECGGTGAVSKLPPSIRGLSPRVRGNQLQAKCSRLR